MLTQEEFYKGMAMLVSAYPTFPLSTETTEIYSQRLQNLSPREFEWAVLNHIDNHKWFPTISELLKAAQERLPTAVDAWQRLLAAAEDGEKPEMDPATERALAVIGGWEEFSRTSYDTLHFRFKEFKAAYLEARDREGTVPELEGGGRPPLQIER